MCSGMLYWKAWIPFWEYRSSAFMETEVMRPPLLCCHLSFLETILNYMTKWKGGGGGGEGFPPPPFYSVTKEIRLLSIVIVNVQPPVMSTWNNETYRRWSLWEDLDSKRPQCWFDNIGPDCILMYCQVLQSLQKCVCWNWCISLSFVFEITCLILV